MILDRRKKINILLDKEQLELVEKLSVFFGDEEDGVPVTDKIIEQAIKSYTDKQVEYIVSRYAIDLRHTPIAQMREYRREVCVGIAERDTIIVPMNECAHSREAVFERRIAEGLRIDMNKAPHLNYIAFYWNTPTLGISHYAKIISIEPSPEDTEKVSIYFDAPEELPERIQARDPQYRVRRPKYTMLTILLEAKTLEELFSPA